MPFEIGAFEIADLRPGRGVLPWAHVGRPTSAASARLRARLAAGPRRGQQVGASGAPGRATRGELLRAAEVAATHRKPTPSLLTRPPRGRPARAVLARIRARPPGSGWAPRGRPLSPQPSMTSFPDVAQRDDRGAAGHPRGHRARSSKISGDRGNPVAGQRPVSPSRAPRSRTRGLRDRPREPLARLERVWASSTLAWPVNLRRGITPLGKSPACREVFLSRVGWRRVVLELTARRADSRVPLSRRGLAGQVR